MKKIISLIVLVFILALSEPIIGQASEFQEASTGGSFDQEGKHPLSEQNSAAFTETAYQSKDAFYQGQTTFFLNRAFMSTAGQVNGATIAASNFAAYQSIINNKAINRANRYIDGANQPEPRIVHGKQLSPTTSELLDQSLETAPSMPNMTVKFLDVGQGDAIYIEYPNGKTALVDAGRSDSVIDAALKAANINRIDTLIATHPDADHTGGAAFVIKNYGVTKVIDGGQKGTTQSYLNYLEAVKTSGVQFELAEIGDNVSDDDTVSAEVLFVDRNASELNDGCIVIMLSYGLTDILLAADAEIAVEKYLINNYDLNAEVLKVAHHGADTGTSKDFIKAVSPADAILQYGFNLFGLPHAKVVNDLVSAGASIYSTHDRGTITINTDGKSYSINSDFPQGTGKSVLTSNQLRITAKDLDGEVVTVKNIGSTTVTMTGWILLSVKGHQSFTFPDGFVLNAGESVNITSGPSAVDNPPYSLKWTESYMWNQKGDPAKLYDPFRKVIHKLD